MALGTITKVTDYTDSNKRVRVRDVQLTSGANYTTGGETITAAAVGLRKIEEYIAMGLPTTASGTTSRGVSFIAQSNGSVKMQVQTTASAEAGSNSDQSTFTVRIRFSGF